MVSRRRVLQVGAGIGALGVAGAIFKPNDRGAGYSSYFSKLNQELQQSRIDRPSVVIDMDLLDKNLHALKQTLASKQRKTFRIVVKSLPSMELVNYIAKQTATNAFMVFHRPFLQQLVNQRPDADVLFGKPMPVAAAEQFYREFTKQPSSFDHQQQLQWLIDTPQRLAQYLALAKVQQIKLNVNFEIDVGLHRGGFSNQDDFLAGLKMIADNPDYLSFGGLMGYDAHVSKFPGFLGDREFESVKRIYLNYRQLLAEHYPQLYKDDLCFNGAGSPTIERYQQQGFINDISAGSCLLKTTSFDIASLTAFEPCCYIASPVLKKHPNTGLPTLEWLGDIEAAWDPNKTYNYFIYSGNWLAEPVAPRGLSFNGTYVSSNQQGLQGAPSTQLAVDDFVFLRPTQSEAVLLQFGDLLMIRGGKVAERWSIIETRV